MANASTFEEFVTTRSAGLLRVAILLTRDHALAEDLLQTALARSWSVWKRIDGDPEPYVHRILANTYNTWWRRRWHAERPTERLPELGEPGGQLNVEERDEIWRALNRLPRQQRAVLVLRYFEDLTEAQVAQTLAISVGAVKSHANRGLAKLRLDPALLAEFPVPRPPASTPRLAAVRERVRQRRQHRVMGAVAIVIALLAGLAVVPHVLHRVFPPAKTPVPQHFRGYLVKDRLSAKLTALDLLTTTWRPSTPDYMLTASCDTGDGQVVATAAVYLNGKPMGDFPCSADPEPLGTRTANPDPAGENLKIGEPVEIAVRLQILHGTHLPATGTISIAFAELVPFDQLPLPKRPRKLPKLQDPGYLHPVAVLRANGRTSATVTLRAGELVSMAVTSQTPGHVHLAVDGQPLKTVSFYDYSAPISFPTVDPAARVVTISATAEHTTGDWYVALTPAPIPTRR